MKKGGEARNSTVVCFIKKKKKKKKHQQINIFTHFCMDAWLIHVPE